MAWALVTIKSYRPLSCLQIQSAEAEGFRFAPMVVMESRRGERDAGSCRRIPQGYRCVIFVSVSSVPRPLCAHAQYFRRDYFVTIQGCWAKGTKNTNAM